MPVVPNARRGSPACRRGAIRSRDRIGRTPCRRRGRSRRSGGGSPRCRTRCRRGTRSSRSAPAPGWGAVRGGRSPRDRRRGRSTRSTTTRSTTTPQDRTDGRVRRCSCAARSTTDSQSGSSPWWSSENESGGPHITLARVAVTTMIGRAERHPVVEIDELATGGRAPARPRLLFRRQARQRRSVPVRTLEEQAVPDVGRRVADVRDLEVDQGRDVGAVDDRVHEARVAHAQCRRRLGRRRDVGRQPVEHREVSGRDRLVDDRRAARRASSPTRRPRRADRRTRWRPRRGRRGARRRAHRGTSPTPRVACRRPRRGTSRRGTRSATRRERCDPRPIPSRSTDDQRPGCRDRSRPPRAPAHRLRPSASTTARFTARVEGVHDARMARRLEHHAARALVGPVPRRRSATRRSRGLGAAARAPRARAVDRGRRSATPATRHGR